MSEKTARALYLIALDMHNIRPDDVFGEDSAERLESLISYMENQTLTAETVESMRERLPPQT